MLKRLDWNVLNEYLDNDLLIVQEHPEKDLWILNYSKTCQYERAWDEITLACRGLVVDKNGTIVARPFSKFFNMEEYEAYEDLPNVPYSESWEAFEKMDGSLGILFFYDGSWIFASRGSFTSEQAIKGSALYNEYLLDNLILETDKTYLFEIIYPSNRIVVNYSDEEKLVLLGALVTETGTEVSYDELEGKYHKVLPLVPRYTGIKDFDLMKGFNLENKEGYVIRFSSGFRMKIKFEEYCRLHTIVTNVSNKTVWEHLKNATSFEDLLERVPDEFYAWVSKTKKELEDAYKDIELKCYKKVIEILRESPAMTDPISRKKFFALKAKDHKYSGILFSIYDGKDYSETIWKLVRPEYSKPFKDVIEE
jgi:RNA ligase